MVRESQKHSQVKHGLLFEAETQHSLGVPRPRAFHIVILVLFTGFAAGVVAVVWQLALAFGRVHAVLCPR